MTRPGPTPVLLDTDIGTNADDALALALLLRSPEVALRAVTTVSGDTALRAAIARHLIDLGPGPPVPVVPGRARPLGGEGGFRWFGHEGHRVLAGPAAAAPPAGDAVAFLGEAIAAWRPHVVALGPLTNLAAALLRTPDLAAAVPRVTVVGGVLGPADGGPDGGGASYNLDSDPEAARIVFEAGIPLTIVPLDVSRRIVLTAGDLARLRRAAAPLARTVCAALEVWWPVHQALFAVPRGYAADVVCVLHDPLAVAALVAPRLVRCVRRRLRLERGGGGLRLVDDRGAPERIVVADAEAEGVRELVVGRLAGAAGLA